MVWVYDKIESYKFLASQIINGAKILSKIADPNTANQLLAAAKAAADALSGLVSAAKTVSSNVNDYAAKSELAK